MSEHTASGEPMNLVFSNCPSYGSDRTNDGALVRQRRLESREVTDEWLRGITDKRSVPRAQVERWEWLRGEGGSDE